MGNVLAAEEGSTATWVPEMEKERGIAWIDFQVCTVV